jgi:hypothetical protein
MRCKTSSRDLENDGDADGSDYCPASEVERNHHDITTLADDLLAGDSVELQDLYNLMYSGPVPELLRDGYAGLPERTVYLKDLRDMYMRNMPNRAIGGLHQRSTLKIDEEFMVDTQNRNDYCFSCDRTFLDFILIVGAEAGIDMFIPNVVADSHFALELDLRLQIKEFRAKHGALGFNPSGAMLCIAQSPVEDFWLGIAPIEFFDETEPPFVMKGYRGDTRLSRLHYRIIYIFLLTVLETLDGRDFYIQNPHAIDLHLPTFNPVVSSSAR